MITGTTHYSQAQAMTQSQAFCSAMQALDSAKKSSTALNAPNGFAQLLDGVRNATDPDQTGATSSAGTTPPPTSNLTRETPHVRHQMHHPHHPATTLTTLASDAASAYLTGGTAVGSALNAIL